MKKRALKTNVNIVAQVNLYKTMVFTLTLIVSESDILGPIDYFSDIEILEPLKGICLQVTVLKIK